MDELARLQQQGITVMEVSADGLIPAEYLTEIEALRDKLIVLTNPDVSSATDVARQLIQELEDNESIDDVVAEIWPSASRRVGITGGVAHMALRFLSSVTGPCDDPWGFYPNTESYFDYRQRIREEEVYRQTRRPPKHAVCSARRRGRKFKG